MSTGSTIVAIATGPSSGGIGVVRLSGPAALEVGRRLAPGLGDAPVARRAVFTPLLDAQGTTVDEGLALYFQAPHSYTGEEVVELHAHGSPRLLALLVEAALAGGEARPAEAGEFTRRAFLNGRIDLTRAEAVAELVAAQSEAQVRAAAAQLAGGLFEAVQAVKAPLLGLSADLEAALDFPDEAEEVEAGVAARLERVRGEVAALVERCRRGALIRSGAQVVLFGPVNAGKSTLFNRLVGDARALVDHAPGTTRDALFAQVEWGGLAITVVDTAGLRADAERVEALGIARTRMVVAGADVAVLLVPPDSTPAAVQAWSAEVASAGALMVVRSKADLEKTNNTNVLHVSGRTGAGVDALRTLLLERLAGAQGEAVALGGVRHRDGLVRAGEALGRAAEALKASTLEVVAGEVGLALAAVGEVSGEDASHEVIDAIFQRFCIGK